MKPLKYYSTFEVPYPNRDEFTDVFVYSRGNVVFSGPFNEYKKRASQFAGMLVEKTVNEAGLKEQRIRYGAEQTRLEQEFKRDLFEEHGVTENPKAGLCYGLAYNYAGWHRNYSDIVRYFSELVALIK